MDKDNLVTIVSALLSNFAGMPDSESIDKAIATARDILAKLD